MLSLLGLCSSLVCYADDFEAIYSASDGDLHFQRLDNTVDSGLVYSEGVIYSSGDFYQFGINEAGDRFELAIHANDEEFNLAKVTFRSLVDGKDIVRTWLKMTAGKKLNLKLWLEKNNRSRVEVEFWLGENDALLYKAILHLIQDNGFMTVDEIDLAWLALSGGIQADYTVCPAINGVFTEQSLKEQYSFSTLGDALFRLGDIGLAGEDPRYEEYLGSRDDERNKQHLGFISERIRDANGNVTEAREAEYSIYLYAIALSRVKK